MCRKPPYVLRNDSVAKSRMAILHAHCAVEISLATVKLSVRVKGYYGEQKAQMVFTTVQRNEEYVAVT
jgi:hypothetical protein